MISWDFIRLWSKSYIGDVRLACQGYDSSPRSGGKPGFLKEAAFLEFENQGVDENLYALLPTESRSLQAASRTLTSKLA
jgi:hypothetical protein